mmetsp:Transcript_112307/g.199063  ORF Transcript_112307/g.199063 Transcript_112307/m.199063 type:complete len:301 (+) Transcript_112307:456-1358(+)
MFLRNLADTAPFAPEPARCYAQTPATRHSRKAAVSVPLAEKIARSRGHSDGRPTTSRAHSHQRTRAHALDVRQHASSAFSSEGGLHRRHGACVSRPHSYTACIPAPACTLTKSRQQGRRCSRKAAARSREKRLGDITRHAHLNKARHERADNALTFKLRALLQKVSCLLPTRTLVVKSVHCCNRCLNQRLALQNVANLVEVNSSISGDVNLTSVDEVQRGLEVRMALLWQQLREINTWHERQLPFRYASRATTACPMSSSAHPQDLRLCRSCRQSNILCEAGATTESALEEAAAPGSFGQ